MNGIKDNLAKKPAVTVNIKSQKGDNQKEWIDKQLDETPSSCEGCRFASDCCNIDGRCEDER